MKFFGFIKTLFLWYNLDRGDVNIEKSKRGIFLIILGNVLYLYYTFFGGKASSHFGDFVSGVLLGISVAVNILGIILVSKAISGKDDK